MRLFIFCTAVSLAACDSTEPPVIPGGPAPLAAPAPAEMFRDMTKAARLDFTHVNGASGEYFFPEIMGSGVAVFDYDSDGDLDIYAVQSGTLGAQSLATAGSGPRNRLYRNELEPSGELRFTDVSEKAGVDHAGYGMGVAVADWDNDGHQDLYVTNVGPNVQYRNNGDGTFSAVTSQAEASDSNWSTSASFLDYDRDGDLDLYVANYVAFSTTNNIPCSGSTGQRDYCDPNSYAPERDRLWRNDGISFVDVTVDSGVSRVAGNGLGVTAADFNGDGWPDIYVANDQAANFLWINQRDGTFAEEALLSGNAYNGDGSPEASMGVTAGDYDGDGDEDLFMTHLRSETNTLYRNDGSGAFVDMTALSGLAQPSMGYTGFGTRWFDANNNGRLDLFIANGAVQLEQTQIAREKFPYLQKNQLLLLEEDGKFVDFSRWSGAAMQIEAISRGAAFGDIDNDGDTDVVVSNNHGPMTLLINNANSSAWLRVRLIGSKSNRDGVDASVTVLRGDEPLYWRRVHTDGSYLSASDPRVLFGLSDAEGVDGVLVKWPTGRKERWDVQHINQEIELVEGSGR